MRTWLNWIRILFGKKPIFNCVRRVRVDFHEIGSGKPLESYEVEGFVNILDAVNHVIQTHEGKIFFEHAIDEPQNR